MWMPMVPHGCTGSGLSPPPCQRILKPEWPGTGEAGTYMEQGCCVTNLAQWFPTKVGETVGHPTSRCVARHRNSNIPLRICGPDTPFPTNPPETVAVIGFGPLLAMVTLTSCFSKYRARGSRTPPNPIQIDRTGRMSVHGLFRC